MTPPAPFIELFKRALIPISAERKDLTEKNANLVLTRDLLLPKIISGEIDVSDFDINVGVMNDGS